MSVIFETYSGAIMKLKLFIALGVLALGGCATQPATFSWYHPDGGEYLFAYDSDACTETVISQGGQLGTDLDGPFFQCMHARGYYLVDGERIVQAPPAEVVALEQQVSQQ